MNEFESGSDAMDVFEIPKDAIVLNSGVTGEFRKLAVKALQKVLIDRNLNLSLGPQLDLENHNRTLIFNHFAVQLVTSGMYADKIKIPLDEWFKQGLAPQLLLAVQVDDENNVVWFRGVLTASEFNKLVSKNVVGKSEISLSVEVFEGGVERLLRLEFQL